MMNNKKGVTLIELVVVMVISVIFMGIAGTILLSATGYFTKTTIADQDKLALDKIVEFVDDQIMYATNVIVSDLEASSVINSGDNWHYLKFEKGKVYFGQTTLNHDSKVYENLSSTSAFSDGYFGNRILIVSAKGYENSYRLDLDYNFNDGSGDSVYKTKSTIAFPNLMIQYEQGHKGWFDSVEYSSKNDKYFYIYYNVDSKVQKNTITSASEGNGTVADQIVCKGEVKARRFVKGENYKFGEFVEVCRTDLANNTGEDCETDVYRYVNPSANSNGDIVYNTPGESTPEYWKKISAYYEKNYSNYYEGDVVIFGTNNRNEDVSYVFISSIALKPNYYDSGSIGGYDGIWAPVHRNLYLDSRTLCEIIPSDKDESKARINYTYIYDTAYNKLFDKNIFLDKDGTRGEITKKQKTSGFRPINDRNFDLGDIYIDKKGLYWINISDTIVDAVPDVSKNKVVWQKLQTKWDKDSAYRKDDIVVYGNATYRAVGDVPSGSDFKKSDSGGKWQLVRWIVDKNKDTGGYWVNKY